MKKKIMAAVLAAMCFASAVPVGVMGGAAAESTAVSEQTTKAMTLNDVVELSKKGKKVDWSDFDGFDINWRSSAAFSRFCKVDFGNELFLIVGGEPNFRPDAVWLCYSDTETYVDVKTGDVKAFIDKYAKSDIVTTTAATTTKATTVTTTAATTTKATNVTTTAAATTTTAVTTRTTELPELYKFTVIVLSVSDTTLLVKPDKEYEALKGYDEFVMGINQLNNDIKPTVGMKLEISSLGVGFIDTNPARIGTVVNVTVVSDAPIATKEMTLDDVVELSKKGDALGWSDFEPYKANDASTCIQCWEYDLGNGFNLKVGGPPDGKPDFILLGYYSFKDCDVRTEDVSAFIDFITATYIIIKGDANFDRYVDMSDVVLVMQALANPNKYGLNGTDVKHLTEQGMKNADMDGNGLTVGDAQAIQRKLLHISDIDRSVIAGKTFVYEKEGFGSDFEITFNDDGTYIYSPGILSSYLGSGTWEIEDEYVYMAENTSDNVNYLKINGSALVYRGAGSDNFYGFKVKDGEVFYLKAEEKQPALSDILTIKTDYDPVMSDWSGIGILLEFDSPEYAITLEAADGQFVEWDTVKGSGPVKNEGKTYEIGKSGSIFWEPDDTCYTDGFVAEITVKGTNGDKQVELGKIYITHNDRLVFTASLEKPEISALDSIRKQLSEFFAAEKIDYTVIPKSKMPEQFKDKYVFIKVNTADTSYAVRYGAFLKENNIDNSLIKSIPYKIDSDTELNKIRALLYCYILEHNINASVDPTDEEADLKNKTVLVKYADSANTRTQLESFLKEKNIDLKLVEFLAVE